MYLQANLQNQLKNRRYRCTERVNDICCPSCGSLVSGAGEALCALTQSNTNLYGDPSHSQAYESPRTPDEIKNYHIDYFKRLDKESPRSSTPFFDVSNYLSFYNHLLKIYKIYNYIFLLQLFDI